MTNEQILKKAIEKVVKNGFDKEKYMDYGDTLIEWVENEQEQWRTLGEAVGLETFIFSHDFAKAFWGDKINITDCIDVCHSMGLCKNCCIRQSEWEHQLKIMVLESEPLKYLEKFLKEK